MSNHDELMSNFFAQPDALALGKTADELKAVLSSAVNFAHTEQAGIPYFQALKTLQAEGVAEKLVALGTLEILRQGCHSTKGRSDFVREVV